MHTRDHMHFIIRAKVKNPAKSEEYITGWMESLIKAIDMKVMMGPYSKYLDEPGNRGLTSIAVIETSHIAGHFWDEPDENGECLLELDIFSCKEFDPQIVLKAIEIFDVVSKQYLFLDRDEWKLISGDVEYS